jgi:hypothetical protein
VISIYKKYVVRLTDQERGKLETLVRRGRAHARKLLYARILLKASADCPDQWTDERIAEALEVSTATVARESVGAFAKMGSRWRSCPRSQAGLEEGFWTGEPRLI